MIAIRLRCVDKLKLAIKDAEDKRFQGKFGVKLAMAHRVIEQREKLTTLKQAVQHLNHITINKLKSYSHPPEPVHEVMMATLMLLGEDQHQLMVCILDYEVNQCCFCL